MSGCKNIADQLSCDAMHSLARTALLADQQHQSYLTNDPSCFRNQEEADRWDEYFLQKSLGISRNVCFEKTPDFQNGVWQSQFPPMTVHEPTFFEKWTRARNARVQCAPVERPSCFASFTPPAFPGPEAFSFRR